MLDWAEFVLNFISFWLGWVGLGWAGLGWGWAVVASSAGPGSLPGWAALEEHKVAALRLADAFNVEGPSFADGAAETAPAGLASSSSAVGSLASDPAGFRPAGAAAPTFAAAVQAKAAATPMAAPTFAAGVQAKAMADPRGVAVGMTDAPPQLTPHLTSPRRVMTPPP